MRILGLTCLTPALLVVTACGVEKAEDRVNVFSFEIDGQPFIVDLVPDAAAPSYAFAWDDTQTHPKRHDPLWELIITAKDRRQRNVYFSTRQQFGAGPHQMERAYLPRAGSPWLALAYEDATGIRDFRPAKGSEIIMGDSAAGGRLRMEFDRITMLDACFDSVELTNGLVDLELVTTEVHPVLYQLADEGLTQDQVEGDAWFILDGEPFYSYAPWTESEVAIDGNEYIYTVVPNWCDERYQVISVGQMPIPHGLVPVQGFTFGYVDLDDTPLDFTDDRFWKGVEGEIFMQRPDGDDLLEGFVASPITLRFTLIDPYTGEQTPVAGQDRVITAGEFAVLVGDGY